MRWVFDQILQQARQLARSAGRPAAAVGAGAPRLAPGADGAPQQLDLHADLQASADAIARFAGPAEGRRYLAFCDEARRVYQRLEGPHIRSPRPERGRA